MRAVLGGVDVVALLNVFGLLLLVFGVGVLVAALVSLAVGIGAGLIVGGAAVLLLAQAVERS